MHKQIDQTIPYRLSEAELENLRLLRKRMNPAATISQNKGQEKISEEIDFPNSHGLHQTNSNKKGNRP